MRVLLTILVLLLAGCVGVRHLERTRPQDVPWVPIELAHAPGRMTPWKVARLSADPAACRALLAAGGIAFEPVPDRVTGPGCGFAGAVRVSSIGLPLRPGGLTMTCPAAVALAIWTRHVVIPETQARLATSATGLVNFGTYSCRAIAGSDRQSQHATANAVDIAGIRTRLGDVSLLTDWPGGEPRAGYLRALRDGACRSFTTVLSPDYNAAHADHFHMDMSGWNSCR